MKIPGHHWCPKCDDISFGQFCQACQTAAEFVPDPLVAVVVRPPQSPNFNPPPGWFEQLRAACK